ncbi:ExbD/TolR family protein [Saccharophagus degradans]|uniref:Biopolymer transport protein ExbD/TolR n=1 Tax=Saccharophagus degradans (strain 2-40 / ATCC 43961 / DSM 17024) TaxID=203122 RepID=Q21HT5_SACD2|nr:biopolymer transporter ExbD [Saccharophagus degradans]ABD81744.1 Biopolymer transport protein ExbD/TolR [Saccharophagus degradans 2-40]
MNRKARAITADDKADVDLTPMLDVVFIMLIFFIVTASFVTERVIGLNLPENAPVQPISPTPSLLVEVSANNDIYINNRRVDASAVRALIAQKHAELPEAGLVIRAHELSSAETYVLVADAAQQARVNNISLVPFADK